MNRTLQLDALVELSPFLSEGELVALNVGPDSQLYAVIAQKPLDYREKALGSASFAKTIPSQPQTYRVLAFFGSDVTLDVHIKDERFNIHDVQPLSRGELLLVCCRSHYRAPGDFDRNGRVYGPDGQLVRELLLGDGIAAVQTTDCGLIWTSFFDEGVFGNYGWKQPVGAAGLVAWSASGERVYEFSPGGGLDSIDDCYALNVESDSSTWLYYYSGFPLVLLRDRRIEAHWDVPIRGSGALAVSPGSALFSGGYKEKDTCHLFELEPGRVRAAGDFGLVDETGDKLVPERVIGRGGALHFLRAGRVYRLDLAKICH